MSLRDTLKESMKEAMRAKESLKLGTLRLILAAIKDRDISVRTTADVDEDDDKVVQDILSKMIKQRRDSIKAYEQGGRLELVEREQAEIEVIEAYLPKQLSEDEMKSVVGEMISELNADGLKDMGRTMGALKDKYAGQMDFSRASLMVKEILAG